MAALAEDEGSHIPDVIEQDAWYVTTRDGVREGPARTVATSKRTNLNEWTTLNRRFAVSCASKSRLCASRRSQMDTEEQGHCRWLMHLIPSSHES